MLRVHLIERGAYKIMFGSSSIYLIPGMEISLVVSNMAPKVGNFIYLDENSEYKTVQLINGFFLVDETSGILTPGSGNSSATYVHTKFSKNRIVFVSVNKDIATLDIIAAPIHDHSSVLTGGPAFGTYFSDDDSGSGGIEQGTGGD